MYNATINGHLDKLKLLLTTRANENDKNPVIYKEVGVEFTVLHIAAWYGHEDILEYYKNDLHFQPDINPLDKTKLYTPMMLAAQSGQKSVVSFFLDEVNETIWNRPSDSSYIFDKGFTPLHWAATKGHDDIVQLLLEKVSDKMPRTGSGLTPLHESAMYGHVNIAKKIIESLNGTVDINPHALILLRLLLIYLFGY